MVILSEKTFFSDPVFAVIVKKLADVTWSGVPEMEQSFSSLKPEGSCGED